MVIGEQQSNRHGLLLRKIRAARLDIGDPSGKDVSEGGHLSRRSILVVEDDDSTRAYLGTLLSSLDYDVASSASGEEALARLQAGPLPALVLLDLILPGLAGVAVLDHIRSAHPALPVIVLSTVAQLKTVVDAVKRGASDYLTKPFAEQELELAIHNALEKQDLHEQVRTLRQQLGERPGAPVSNHPSMQRIREIAPQVADTDAPVLITGESGVGKEVLARFIHAQSGRRARPLVKVNCAALPQDLLESELFGYERGAFSGRGARQAGQVRAGRPGLDPARRDRRDEPAPAGQAAARAAGRRVHAGWAARDPVRVDARVLATTNCRLEEAVAAGRFREDLYFRLNVIRIEIPPLRERLEDVPLLCDHFVRRYAPRYGSAVRARFPRSCCRRSCATTGRATCASWRTPCGAT